MSATARRTTRAQSRASSRAGSEDATSVAGEGSATPARSSQRLRNRATPAKEAVQTGRDIGNRGSAAYGAKGKIFSAPKLSVDDALKAPAELLESHVQDARARSSLAPRRAGSLPPVSEESPPPRSPALLYGALPESGGKAPSPATGAAHGTGAHFENGQPPVTAATEGTTANPHVIPDRTSVQRSLFKRIADHISVWFGLYNHGVPAQTPDAAAAGVLADDNAKSSGIPGYGEELDDFEGRSRGAAAGPSTASQPTSARRPTAPATLPWLYRLIIALVLISSGILLAFRLGFIFGLRSDPLDSRIMAQSGEAGAKFRISLDRRMGSLEKLHDNLASHSRLGQATTSEYQQVDWFAAANGAGVNPHQTSPAYIRTCRKKKASELSWKVRAVGFFLGSEGVCIEDAAAGALKSWSDVDENFCAPPEKGKLQLSVITQRVIAPTELVLEHPKDALIKKGTTPKELELWANIDDQDIRSDLHRTIIARHPSLFVESSPQKERELSSVQSLPPTFIPIGRWVYDLYAKNYIQNFRLPYDLQGLGVKTDKFVVRVNSNWGNTHPTCLFRVRLHGHDMSGETEQLEAPLSQ